jgi:hypothetical protein
LQKYNNWVCPKKSAPFHWLGVHLNLFKVLGHTWDPSGVTPRVITQFLGAWEARKKRGVFLILFCIYYILHTAFSREESWKSFVSAATS